jgi:serpin B
MQIVASAVIIRPMDPAARPTSSPSRTPASPAWAEAASPAAVRAAAAVNALGFDLSRALAASAEAPNLVFSPASVALALALTRPGARGTTATQLEAVLRDLADEVAGTELVRALGLALAARSGAVDALDGPGEVVLEIANAAFGQRGLAFERAYLGALASGFGADLHLVDYKADAGEARRTINAWVAERTADRITDLLGPDALTADARLTLVSAVYLKAAWAAPFADGGPTRAEPFFRRDDSAVDVPMMRRSGQMRHASGMGWQAVGLPYLGGQLEMLIVMPDSMADFERGLDAPVFTSITTALSWQQVDLGLPRFSVATKTVLAKVLAALGMPDAFDRETADFSGITKEERLSISHVVHQANIDVDESGTEASAATAVALQALALPGLQREPLRLTVDRPFVFAVLDLGTGAVLFLGRIGDPSAER